VRVVGLTGGIGSGKSTLAAEFAALGVPVIDADAVARRCVGPGSPVLAAIVARFGAGILRADGTLDRGALGAVVFADAGARAELEALTHPCIREGIRDDLAALRASATPPALAVLEHPLLVESGAHAGVDVVVVVEAPLAERVARLTQQRGMAVEQVEARIAAQLDDEARRRVADHVVVNDGGRDALHREAVRLLAVLTNPGGAS